MYITRLSLRNIRCFDKLDLHFDLSGPHLPWTLILGDNASGKTVLLKSIAIGLCDEPSAAGLIKESEEGYIRRNEDEGSILLEITPSPRSRIKYEIITKLKRVKTWGGVYEAVSKPERISERISWQRIFVCGYGAGRTTSGTGDIPSYSAINAVYSLFNYTEGLQNPEIMLKRLTRLKTRNAILNFLSDFLLGENKSIPARTRGNLGAVQLHKTGITFDGPWGRRMPFRDLADGYKSGLLWLTDFLGWAVSQFPDIKNVSQIQGIVLIDEIEQHLHPSWQTRIVDDLRKYFPKTQFIVTTHSPVVAASVGHVDTRRDNDTILYLESEKGITVPHYDIPSMKGWRLDQILASKSFKYVTMRETDIDKILRETSKLAHKKDRLNEKERARYNRLKKIISEKVFTGQSQIEIELKKEMRAETLKWISFLERNLEEKSDD